MREEDEENKEEEKRKRTKRSLCLRVNLAGLGRFSYAGKVDAIDSVG